MEMKLMPRHLPNVGVVEGMLPKEIMDNIWKLVNESKKKPDNMKSELAGNINSSIRLDTTNPLLENFMQIIKMYLTNMVMICQIMINMTKIEKQD